MTLSVPTGARARRVAARCLVLALAARLFVPNALAAQQGVTVRGVVRGADARPLGLAEIIAGDSVLARTDSAGRFTIAADSAPYSCSLARPLSSPNRSSAVATP